MYKKIKIMDRSTRHFFERVLRSFTRRGVLRTLRGEAWYGAPARRRMRPGTTHTRRMRHRWPGARGCGCHTIAYRRGRVILSTFFGPVTSENQTETIPATPSGRGSWAKTQSVTPKKTQSLTNPPGGHPQAIVWWGPMGVVQDGVRVGASLGGG